MDYFKKHDVENLEIEVKTEIETCTNKHEDNLNDLESHLKDEIYSLEHASTVENMNNIFNTIKNLVGDNGSIENEYRDFDKLCIQIVKTHSPRLLEVVKQSISKFAEQFLLISPYESSDQEIKTKDKSQNQNNDGLIKCRNGTQYVSSLSTLELVSKWIQPPPAEEPETAANENEDIEPKGKPT